MSEPTIKQLLHTIRSCKRNLKESTNEQDRKYFQGILDNANYWFKLKRGQV